MAIKGKARCAALLGVCALMAACSGDEMTEPALSPAAFKQAMLAEVQQLTADFNSGDVAKLGRHYASDQVLMVDGGANLDAAGARARRSQQTQYDIQLTNSDIVVYAPASQDMATVRSTCVVTVFDKTTRQPVAPPQPNNCLLGYRRQADGTMKVNWGLTVPIVPHTVK